VKPPDHDSAAKERLPSRIIATWPVETFIENIAAREDGALVVSIVTGKQLALVQPGCLSGARVLHVYRARPRAACARLGARRRGQAGDPGRAIRDDDLALDAHGNLYVVTHVHNQLQRLSPDGTRTVLAGADDGMHGVTAVAFGQLDEDRRALYVTTTGGIVMPVDGHVREAKLVRLELGVEGAPLNGV
jgi:sugar lactone lactonase YvrE